MVEVFFKQRQVRLRLDNADDVRQSAKNSFQIIITPFINLNILQAHQITAW